MRLTRAVKKILKPIYHRLPSAISYGPQFSPTLALLRKSQHWSEERLIEFQLSKLRKILQHSARHVPYYRNLFRKLGFDPERVRDVADLRALPFLDKETVRANLEDLLAENIKPRQRLYFTTGGSTGVPLGVYNLRHSGGRERAFMLAQWERIGFRYTDRRAMLRGWPVNNPQHWRYDASERAYLFSNFHMIPDNVARYARVMREKRIPFLHSFPSAVVDFARHLDALSIEPPRFRVILVSSENLYPGQRESINSFFGAPLFSWYGQTEDVILAGECETSSHYHIFPEYGVAEVIKHDGMPALSEGEEGELVGTSLDNFAMPLIRYRTDDWAVVGPASCACGRNYKLLKETRGRWHQEMLVGRLDNLISVTALNVHTDVLDRVRQVQFYQREKGRVELRIRRGPGYTDQDSHRIVAALNEKMGDTMEVTLSFPDEISLSPRGKFRFVVQELKVPRPAAEGASLEASW